MQVDRRARFDPLCEVVALQHTLHGDLAGQAEHVEEIEAAEPFTVITDLCFVDVDDFGDLLKIIAGIGLDLFLSEARARLIAAARVADQGGAVADDEHRLVAQFLEEPQLAQGDGVAEMNVNAGGVDAVLDAEGLAGLDAALELLTQLGLRLDLVNTAADERQLFLNRFHRYVL